MIENDWNELLKAEYDKEYFKSIKIFLEKERKQYRIYPEGKNIFSALNKTSYKNTKVVILGQDPYHGENQAHGLSFSVKDGTAMPPSLKNIYKELYSDLGIEYPKTGDLTKWAEEGVLLLNTVLTVRANQANSHKDIGWEKFTDRIIKLLSEKESPVIFVLWGKQAEKKEELIDKDCNLILKSSHPSPFSAHISFLGSKPFSKINSILSENNQREIDWKI